MNHEEYSEYRYALAERALQLRDTCSECDRPRLSWRQVGALLSEERGHNVSTTVIWAAVKRLESRPIR